MRHSYELQVQFPTTGEWHGFTGGQCSREFGVGYVFACKEQPGPRLGVRLVREDGKVVEIAVGLDEASIGMVAGSPTAQQYRDAAARCIQRAELIEKHGQGAA